MKKLFTLFFSCLFLFFSLLSFGQKNILQQQNFLKFIENKQQWQEDFLFKAVIPSGNLFLKKNRLVYNFYDHITYGKLIADLHDHGSSNHSENHNDSIACHAFSVSFIGANPRPTILGKQPFTEKRNYFYGEIKATDVQAFQKIVYNNLFDNTDLHIFQHGQSLKYEFHLAPNAKASQIKLKYDSIVSIFINEDESLHIKTSLNEVVEQKPYAYQIIDGKTKEVSCRFVLKKNVLSYHLGHYNHKYPLVIDPQLIFSTYSGSESDNWGNTACLDQTGNLYTGGTIFNEVVNGFPATLGAFQTIFQGGDTDIGILKFDSSGTQLLYATYIGGNNSEIPTSLITDDQEDLYILATTGSSNFPTSTNAYQKDFHGSLSEGKWLVNGQVVAKNSQTFTSNTLKEGDQVQFIFNHRFCDDNSTNNTIDSSEIITISEKPKKITASLTASHQNFCAGDSIIFTASHSTIQSPIYEWFINDISIGNNSNIFTSKTLNDGDKVKCKVENTLCGTNAFTNEWIVNEVTGKKITASILSNPEIVCSNGQYQFSLQSAEVGSNASIIWKNKNDTIHIGYGFFKNTVLGDSIYAIIHSDLSCLADTTFFSDTLIINDSQTVTASINIIAPTINPCYGNQNLSVESEYIGVGSIYTLFYNGTNTATSTNGFFSIPNLEGSYKVEVNNTLGCTTSLVSDSMDLTFSKLLQISTSPSDTICTGETILFSNNIPNSAYNNASNVTPVGGYKFSEGTDISIIKLNKNGDQIIASTLIGGYANDGLLLKKGSLDNNYGDILRGDINVDDEGNVYFSSVTQSTDFPIINGVQKNYGGGSSDGVVVKLNPDLSQIIWSSYVGGNDEDALYSIQVDTNKNVYVAGGTLSDDTPITIGSFQTTHQGDVDAIVSKFSADGKSLLASTFLGTTQYDQTYFIQLDDDNDIYVLGQSKGNMPILPDSSIYHQKNAGLFVTKFNNDLSQIIYSTTLGDTIYDDEIIPNISPTAFLVNECENIFIAGWGGETNGISGYNGGFTIDLPLTDNAFQTTTDGSDFYMMVIQKDLNQLLYATYFGGALSAEHVDGGTSRFDEKGIVYQSVCAGCGGFNDFPIFPSLDNDPNTYPKLNNSTNCNNGVIKFDLALLKAGLDTKVLCDNRVEFNNLSVGGVDFQWNFGDGKDTLTLTNNSFIHQYDTAGNYQIKLTARDITTCTAFDIVTDIAIVPNQIGKSSTDTLCLGESITLTPTLKPNATYKWSPIDFITTPTDSIVSLTPTSNISYLVSIIDSFQCEQVDTFNIFALNKLNADFSLPSGCVSKKNVAIKNQSEHSTSFQWNFGDGTNSTITDSLLFHNFPTSNLYYTIQLIANNPNTCNLSDSLQQTLYIPTPASPQKIIDSLCLGEEITITPSIKEKATYEWFPSDFIDNITDSTITITPQQSIAYLISITDSNQCLQIDTVVLEVKNFQPNINHKVLGSCVEFPSVKFQSKLRSSLQYTWNFGDGNVSFEAQPIHTFKKYGNFTVQVSVTDGQCSVNDTTELILDPLYVPNIITPNQDGINDELVIKGIENNGEWYLEIYNRWGDEIYRHEYYNNSWTGENLEDGTYYYLLTAPDQTTCKGWIQITR